MLLLDSLPPTPLQLCSEGICERHLLSDSVCSSFRLSLRKRWQLQWGQLQQRQQKRRGSNIHLRGRRINSRLRVNAGWVLIGDLQHKLFDISFQLAAFVQALRALPTNHPPSQTPTPLPAHPPGGGPSVYLSGRRSVGPPSRIFASCSVFPRHRNPVSLLMLGIKSPLQIAANRYINGDR